MKILHVVTSLTRANGVSVFVCELSAEQAAQGHAVSILVKDLGEDLYPVDSSVIVISQQEIPSSERCDIVHVHALWTPWLTRCAKSARKMGAKLVWSPHGMLTPWALRNKWPKKLVGLLCYQYWALRKSDLLHVTAQSEVEDVRRLRLKNALVVAPLGVRGGCGPLVLTKHPEKTLLFVSRIQKKKGLPNLMEAWAKVPSNIRQGWCIKVVGPDQDGHTAELQEQCRHLGIADEVKFLGPRFGVDRDCLYREADLFVLPTYSENFGSVVIESLAAGTPVVCTKGAPWEELETHSCGRWIDIGVEPLRDALVEMMSLSDEARSRMGQNGVRLVNSKYSWSAVARTIMDGYNKCFPAHSWK